VYHYSEPAPIPGTRSLFDPCVLRATASTVYVRLHGPDQHNLYGGSYPDEALWWWSLRVREWSQQGKDVFVYFNNDGGGNAVRNAVTLRDFAGHERRNAPRPNSSPSSWCSARLACVSNAGRRGAPGALTKPLYRRFRISQRLYLGDSAEWRDQGEHEVAIADGLHVGE
jgi:hypothetical protein